MIAESEVTMTLADKLVRLRKENNYTQEQLADILSVSRQSVSKWESGVAMPETEKIIVLSKLYHCSIDYLLNEEIEVEKSESKSKKEFSLNDTVKKYRALPTFLWSLAYLILSLIFYAIPVAKGAVSNIGYININIYNALSAGVDAIGNIVILFCVLIAIAVFVLAIIILAINKNSKVMHGFYIARKVLVTIETVLWIVVFIIIIDSLNVGIFFLILLSLTNTLGIYLVSFNKLKYLVK